MKSNSRERKWRRVADEDEEALNLRVRKKEMK